MKKRFNKINIEVSNICNLQCSFCPEVVRTKKMMSVDFFRQVIEQASPLTDQVCLHLMGEPLTHPHLEKLIQICQDFSAPIFLVTNAVLLRDKESQLLLHPMIRQVNFSLHSFHDNFPDKDPTQYLQRIFNFTKMAMELRPELYINYRLWNLQETRGTSLQNQEMMRRIQEHFEIQLSSDVDVRHRKSVLIKNRLYLHFDTEFVWPDLSLPIISSSGTCYGLKSHFGILADGTVVPCCLDKEGNIPLGKFPEQSLLDILNQPRAQKMLQGFRSHQLHEELCKRCNYVERFAGV